MNNNFIRANSAIGPRGIMATGTSNITAENTSIEVIRTERANEAFARGLQVLDSGQIQTHNLDLTVTGKSSTGVSNEGNVSSSIILDTGKIIVNNGIGTDGNIAGLFVNKAGRIQTSHFFMEVTNTSNREAVDL